MSARTPRRGIIAPAVGLLLATLLATGAATGVADGPVAASAAASTAAKVIGPGTPSEPGFVGYVLASGGQLGIARLPNGTYALCIDTGAAHPWPTGSLTSQYRTNRIVGYLVGKYMPIGQGDPYTAAALWWAVGLDEQLNSNPSGAAQHVSDLKAQDPAAYQKVAAAHTAMMADANAHAAPRAGYQPNPPTISYTVGGGGIDGLGFTDRSGNWMSGYPMTVRLTGSGEFPGGGTTTTVTSGPQPVSTTWIQTGTIPVTATVTLSGAPADRYTLFTAPSPQQRTVAAAPTTGRSASATEPNGYLRVSTTDRATGAPLAGAQFTAWRDDDNDGVEQAGETPISLTSDSTGVTQLVTALQGEPVCVIETAAATDYRRRFTTSCVAATGTSTSPTVVSFGNDRIWSPTLRTATASSIRVATQPRLAVTVSSTGGHPTTMSWRLLGPLPADSSASTAADACSGLTWTNAASPATGTVSIPGDATYKVAAPALTKPGCYTWAVSTAGHPLIRAASVPAGQAGATFAAQAAPGIVSQVSQRNALPGATISDSLTVTGTTGQIVTGTWTLHGPVVPPYSNGGYTCAAVNWANARVAARGTFATGQDGAVQVGTFTVSKPGCYTYTASVDASPTVTAIPETTPGGRAATSRVTAHPTLTSRVGAQWTSTTMTLFDTVTLSGTARQSVRGTWALYGPRAPRLVSGKYTCTGIDWSTARRRATDTFSASRDGTLGVGATTITKKGCYTYTEKLFASATTAPFGPNRRGVPAETFLWR